MPRKPKEPRPDKPSFDGPLKTKQVATTKVHACKTDTTTLTVRKRWHVALLKHLRTDPSMTRACLAADITKQRVYQAIKAHPRFARKVREAVNQGRKARMQDAEDELYRRAVKGWKEPVYQGGVLVGKRRKYSDALLVKYAEANSKRYAKRTESHSTSISIAFNADSRAALLANPDARELACRLDALLAQPKAIEVSGSVVNGHAQLDPGVTLGEGEGSA